ncbi:MAG: trypsin-like peptidase domain-containing protein, partial [Planctomycetales bacterium]
RADELIEQALRLFSMDVKGNTELVKSKLQEAARLNPQSAQAECIRGLLNVMVAMNPKLAHKNFMACLKRAPGNHAILNNLAITEVKMRKFPVALNRWEKILKAQPESPYVTHNLGRLVMVHNDKRLVMPKGSYNKCAELYASAVTGDKNPETDDEVGWILLAYVDPEPEEVAEKDPRLDSFIGSGGTGFVVQEEYIVTNRHVVEDENATGIKILIPSESKLLDAEVVAMSDTSDIAVVRCKELKMKGLSLTDQLPRRGSEIMVLGFPQFDQLGATIKSTRGAVTSLPSTATDNMVLLDAEINSGNSGGPIANKYGQIVAVTTAVYKPIGGTGGRYGAGIPVISAMPFLRRHIPGLESETSTGEALSWPDVDEKVSESTVLVLVEMSDPPPEDIDDSIVPLDD